MFTKAVQTFRRHARRPVGRTVLIALAMVIAVAVVFRVVTPFLISTNVVRESIEQSVEQWTGHNATIGGVSTIRFWPEPEVTLTDITIHSDAQGEHKTLATISELSASFDLMEALLGQPVFEDFRLTEPHVFMSRDKDGRVHWANGGRLSDAMAKAAANGDRQRLDQALDAPIGEVQVQNGVVEITGETDGGTVRFEAINGVMDWPQLSDTATIRGEAVVRGKKIGVDIRSTQPLLLLDGRSGDFEGTVSADIGFAKFDGLASLTPKGYYSGNAELRASDMPAALRWFGADPRLVDGLQSASVSARLIADRQELRFEELSLGLNNEHASGLLELDTPVPGPSKLSGTLAFDHIDLRRLLIALEPAISRDQHALPSLVSNLDLDIRLSSQVASLGGLQLYDVALGLMSSAQQFRLDILDSDLQPGRMTGRISTLKASTGTQNDVQNVAFRAAIRGVDFAAIAQQLQLKGPIPAAQGSLDLLIDVPRPINQDAWNAAVGTINFQTGSGKLNGIDMQAIRQLATQKPYFTLSDTATGSVEFDSIKATATIRNGIADLQDTEIAGRNETIALTGAVPLANSSLALSATITPKDTSQKLNFFIGGAWPTPIFWPMNVPIAKPGE
ncbi:AsmA family protein [Rhizobium wenxiniae]|uniref:AsmA family protein n=1 Tax=Rhizobium wenxiniae TaxID=1737357 RepID=UPI001C6DEB3F|nr:AsmA family protein [Rhizobium wenxiniae]MBW9091576.1 AsmA family protein [Rhizobium wenxiniae]